MYNAFISKIKAYIKEQRMLEGSETVILGVSGGADSVALLSVLHDLSKESDLKLKVVHVNHGLRPEAAAEAEYVRSLCIERDIPFFLKNADIRALAKEQGVGVEEAGRRFRYEAFNELCNAGDRIAVAHNMNDCAETMLFHLIRGTGVRGLSSIPPVRGNIIRPLLCVSRAEIEAFLKEKEIGYCTDSSNFSDEYTRNRIRNGIIPLMQSEISDHAVEHMFSAASRLRELTEFADGIAAKEYRNICVSEKSGHVAFDRSRFEDEDRFIREMLIKLAIDRLVPGNRDITAEHILAACDLVTKDGSRSVDLPYGIVARTTYSQLFLERDTDEKESPVPETTVNIDGSTSVPGAGIINCRKIAPEQADLTRKEYTKCFDYDKINGYLVLRTRRPGDVICINGEGGLKKLKDYFIDEKIDRDKRDKVLLLADGNRILWVLGHRIGEDFKVGNDTKTVLSVEFIGQ